MNIMQIANIPKNISYKKHLEIRGEVVMPISVFNKLNEEQKRNEQKYSQILEIQLVEVLE
jgi:NAD-dependent DNA ligase